MSTQTTRKPYPTDLQDEAWEWIAPLLAQDAGPGRPRTVDIREIANVANLNCLLIFCASRHIHGSISECKEHVLDTFKRSFYIRKRAQ